MYLPVVVRYLAISILPRSVLVQEIAARLALSIGATHDT
jgi:hypothetical protein